MSDENRIRDRVFLRFEDADYYYRSRELEGLQARISTAAEKNDELAEVKAREELYFLLSAGRDANWRRDFFNSCLRPMADVYVSKEATGCLHDFLGRQAFDLGLDEYRACFDKAVEAGEDAVLDCVPVLNAYPEVILKWIACRLEKSGRDADVERKERLLADIVGSRPDAARFYLKLAGLLRNRYRQSADGYFRLCIRLGCDEVVGNAEFLTPDYEMEYVRWFESLCARGDGPADAARISLQPLWATKRENGVFSKSHEAYAERLFRDGPKDEAAAEYVRCAESGYGWAESWLPLHASDPAVAGAVSADLIGSWLKGCKDSADRQRILGRCFILGKGQEFRDDPLCYVCMARCRIEDEDVIGAVQDCLKLDEAVQGGVRDVLSQSALDDFPALRSDLRAMLRKNAGRLVEKEMASKDHDAVVVDELSLDSSRLPSEDLRALGEYVRSGSLEVSPFRASGAPPLCSRYMLLEQLEKLFVGNPMTGLETRTVGYLQKDFGRLATREFEDSIRQVNPMTTCWWLLSKLFGTNDAHERLSGEAALYRMVAKWQRGDDELPLKLLASYWQSLGRGPEYILALRLLLDNDRELRQWLGAKDAKTLFARAYESVSGSVRS